MKRPENRNLLWAAVLVDELARAGVRHAVIAPGSRSTPLAVAFSRDDRFTIHSIIDERAAAFFALGIGKTAGIPAVVVCTSGTAAANFFPAVVEASMSNVPLIVMTADRPHELRDSGANQTIDQVKLYGGYVRWFVDIAPPHANPDDKTLRYLRTTVDRAVVASMGANGGPVHLNVPFEKPLEPLLVEGDVPEGAETVGVRTGNWPTIQIETGVSQLHYSQLQGLTYDISRSPHGILICGPSVPMPVVDALLRLSRVVEYPILTESSSRLFSPNETPDYHLLGGYETFLRGAFAQQVRPQIIIQVGALPVGNALLTFLEKQTQAMRFQIGAPGGWADESQLTTTLIDADPAATLLSLTHIAGKFNASGQWAMDPKWIITWQKAERITWEETDALTGGETVEGEVVADVISGLDARAMVFLANSNPVRHFDQFVRPQHRSIRVEVNRGASGIDGTVASALGAACGRSASGPSVLIIGDLALYHDLNSLHLLRRLDIPLIIVCINNDGGGIFHRLPISKYDPPFRDLFVTPHGLTFEHAAKMFDVPYMLAEMGEDFRAAFKAAVETGGPHLIEVPSDAAKFEQQRLRLIETVAARIKDSGLIDRLKASQEKPSQASPAEKAKETV